MFCPWSVPLWKGGRGFRRFTFCVSFPAFSSIHAPSDPSEPAGGLRALGGHGVMVTLVPQGPGCQAGPLAASLSASCGMFLEPET